MRERVLYFLQLLIGDLFLGVAQPPGPMDGHPAAVVDQLLLVHEDLESSQLGRPLEAHVVQEEHVVPRVVLLVLVDIEAVGDSVELVTEDLPVFGSGCR